MKPLTLLTGIAMLLSCSTSNNKSDAYGNFEATEITLAAQAEGMLEAFDVKKGDRLVKGQVLGYSDTATLHLQRRELTAQKKVVRSKLVNLHARKAVQNQELENVMISYNRIKKLMGENAATQQQFDDVQGKANLAQKNIEATEAQKQGVMAELEVLEVKTEQVENRINKAVITSPVKGTVINKFIEQGELVTPGKPLCKVASLEELELKVYVSGTQLPHIELGQQVEVLIDEDEETNRELSGTVVWIASDAEFTPKVIQTKEERVKLVYAVKIKVPNDGSLKIGMPGEVNF